MTDHSAKNVNMVNMFDERIEKIFFFFYKILLTIFLFRN